MAELERRTMDALAEKITYSEKTVNTIRGRMEQVLNKHCDGDKKLTKIREENTPKFDAYYKTKVLGASNRFSDDVNPFKNIDEDESWKIY